jgi:hypothetical protein
MGRSNQEKEKIRQFRQLASCTEDVAVKFLKQSSWDLNVGLDAFFASDSYSAGNVDNKKLEAWFKEFKDPNEDKC